MTPSSFSKVISRSKLRDRNIELDAGDLLVVPRGIEHWPRAYEEAHVLLIEPAGTPNTEDAPGPRTAVNNGSNC